jgi:hypothetical protein
MDASVGSRLWTRRASGSWPARTGAIPYGAEHHLRDGADALHHAVRAVRLHRMSETMWTFGDIAPEGSEHADIEGFTVVAGDDEVGRVVHATFEPDHHAS